MKFALYGLIGDVLDVFDSSRRDEVIGTISTLLVIGYVIAHLSWSTVFVLAICLEWIVRGIDLHKALAGFKRLRGGK